MSQYEIHQNKDWNKLILALFLNSVSSQYEIHQNKDWNCLQDIICEKQSHNEIPKKVESPPFGRGKCPYGAIWITKTRIETYKKFTIITNFKSQYEIHQNKDWNSLA